MGKEKRNKSLGPRCVHPQAREVKREALECNLKFVGFIVVSCPLKADSKAVIRECQAQIRGVCVCSVSYDLKWCLSLLQQIFPTQESNRGFLHCRQILYQLSYEGSPFKKNHMILQ